MQKRGFILLLSCLACLQVGLASCQLFNPFDRIGNYLAEKVPSKDVDESFRVANEWLAELKRKASFFDKSLVSSLEAFVKLAALRDSKCDNEAYQLIDEADRLAGGKIFYPKSRKAGQVELVVRKLAQDHAITCHKKHVINLNLQLAKMDANSLKKVEYLEYFDRFYYETRLARDICEVKSLSDPQLSLLLKEYLKEMPTMIENNPDFANYKRVVHLEGEKKVVDQMKIREMVDSYIVKPCQVYVPTTANLNELAIRDAKYMRPEMENFFGFTRSPFERAAPMFCLCKLYLDHGLDTISKFAQTLAPEIKFYNSEKDV